MPSEPTLFRWVEPPPLPCYPEAFIPLGYRTYPGRTDETERAFEGDTVPDVNGEQIIGHLIDRHRRNHPDVDHISTPTPNPHNRSEEETLRWRAYNLGRLHAWLEALNAIRTAAAGKDTGP